MAAAHFCFRVRISISEMVQLFKCETCRTRKIKVSNNAPQFCPPAYIIQCDEARPVCHACQIKGRPCKYRLNERSFFIVEPATTAAGIQKTSSTGAEDGSLRETSLDLRTSLTTEGGHGLYQIFVPRRKRGDGSKTTSQKVPTHQQIELPGPRPSLCSSQTRLLSRWAAVMGSDAPEFNPLQIFGSWAQAIPPRVGTDPVLDLAVQYFVHSGEMYRLDVSSNGNPARKTGQEALKSLRQATMARSIDGHLLLAVHLHFLAEIYMSLGSFYYVPHILGLSNMLRARVDASCDEELDYKMIEASHFEEMTEALLGGRDSIYDGLDLIKTAGYQAMPQTDFNIATASMITQAIRLPRLARLVRACVEHPNDGALISETVLLAEELYINQTCSLIGQTLGTTRLAPTVTPKVAEQFPESFHHFPSVEVFSLGVRFCAFSVLLSGLLQTLLSLNIPNLQVDRQRVEEQDIEAATAISMALDHALTVKQSLPLITLRMVVPLQISFGAWHRLEKRDPHGEGGERGLRMQEWCLHLTNSILNLWNAPSDPLSVRRMKAEAFAGGPMLDGVGRKVDWSPLFETI